MAKLKFSDLLCGVEQGDAAYDEARRKLMKYAARFWDDLCKVAGTHPDPVVRARCIGIITGAKDISPSEKRKALEKLLESETDEIPLRSLRYALRFSL
jgi:hypothetical protein